MKLVWLRTKKAHNKLVYVIELNSITGLMLPPIVVSLTSIANKPFFPKKQYLTFLLDFGFLVVNYNETL